MAAHCGQTRRDGRRLNGAAHPSATALVWRVLTLAQWREQPLRVLVTIAVIALGVALSAAVFLINAGALGEFNQATRRLTGEADLILRGPTSGFDEALFAAIAQRPGVRTASAVIELDVPVVGQRQPLKILGLDPLRAGSIQPQLLGDIAGNLLELFEADTVILSASAAQQLGVKPGDRIDVTVGDSPRSLRVLGLLTDGSYPQRLGVMDIANAQWRLDRLGLINRIDLRLEPGTDAVAFRAALDRSLPPGVLAIEPQLERDRAINVSRAYRVNLNMLALVSLLTGSFLVFSTQSLAVLRRRQALGLLRALGVTRGELQNALLAEGVALGAVGALLGVVLGQALAWWVLDWLRGDLGGGQISITTAAQVLQPLPLLGFFLLGTAIASLGAWAPAFEAARRAPSQALRAGDAEPALAQLRGVAPALVLLGLGVGLAFLPATGGIPIFGYSAIAAILFGAVLLVPRVAGAILALLPKSGRSAPDLALARLRGSVGQSTVSLAAIIVSFSLMVAMAVMVYSFRESFEEWLAQALPADMQLRVMPGNDTARLSPQLQRRIAALPGLESVQFQRSVSLLLDAAREPVTLLARDPNADRNEFSLPLIGAAVAAPPDLPAARISEAMVDLYGYRPGSIIELPLAGTRQRFAVVAVFRDYGRSSGAIAIARADYQRMTGDDSATEASLWLAPAYTPEQIEPALRAAAPSRDFLEIRSAGEVRTLSLRAFDRAFAITYALEAVAVIIGLLGIAFAASSAALARRAEFGMLRHVGLRRRDVLAMLAAEGLATSAIGVVYGLVVGIGLSSILVFVVNRQSFNWSVDLAMPWLQLGVVSSALLIAAALTATIAGRAALNTDAVRAVREDW